MIGAASRCIPDMLCAFLPRSIRASSGHSAVVEVSGTRRRHRGLAREEQVEQVRFRELVMPREEVVVMANASHTLIDGMGAMATLRWSASIRIVVATEEEEA